MKTLVLVRHAKSSWSEPGLPDFERPLNDRGRHDAADMAARMVARHLSPDLLVSSPARRALKTARYFAEAFHYPQEEIQLIPELYHPAVEALQRAVLALPDKASTVFLFSHNPGITDFVNSLTPVRIDNLPTSAVFAVALPSAHWADWEHAERRFLFFDYPKSA